ncbi:MAG: COR domain-containing protein [Cyanobacteria bacterium P01_F01_bin.150]
MTQDELLALINQAADEGWTELDLAGEDLNELPPAIGCLNQLEVLILGKFDEKNRRSLGNKLIKLPSEIGQLNRLRQLDLRANQLNELASEISQLKNLKQLDLSANQLYELPPEIGEISSLERLYLRYNQLNELHSSIGQLTNLQQLDLSANQLREIPSEIGQLTDLQELDLRANQINKLPAEIRKLINLKDLDIRYNQINRLPAEIGEIINLRKLDIRYNQLIELPTEIGKIINLKALYIRSNRLIELPVEIGKIVGLEDLEISSNEINNIPVEIGKLKKLRKLDISSNHISEIPAEIGNLKKLFNLDFSDNSINKLPSEIRQLKSLEYLNISANQLSDLPSEIGKIISLKQLDISHNQLRRIPVEIGLLINLNQLDISSNQLSNLPHEIGQLIRLRQLDAGDNKLRFLTTKVGQLKNLQQLDISHNKLSELPSEIANLQDIETLYLYGNPLTNPPPEILVEGIQKIQNYLRQTLEQGKDYLFEAKFLIVGAGAVGKTSLAHKLLDPSYPLDIQQPSTEGIDVLPWDFNLPDGRVFRANIWDFGGQEIYHATHQFFLTKRSLYALVMDTRKEDTDLYYWLSVVSLFSNDSPVLIIKNEKNDRSCEFNERQLRGEFINLKDTLATNLKTNRGLKAVQKMIQQYITSLPHVGNQLPKKWVAVRQALETDPRNYIFTTEYFTICETHGFVKRDDQLQLSDYLHDLGVCLHFQKDPLLKHTIILKPQWSTSAVYSVLDTREVYENYGRFTRDQLDRIWSDDAYSEMRDELLQLMMRFKLCYEIPGRPQHYIAPQLLTHNSPSYEWDLTSNLIFRYHYDFMPKGILTRLIVELHEYIENQCLVWKNGAVFANGTARAEVIEHYPRKEIRIRVSGTGQQEWFAVITHELEKIHQSFDRLQYQALVPCNCFECKGSQNPYDYPYERLQKSLHTRPGQRIQCQESFAMVSVRGLLANILFPQPISFTDLLPASQLPERGFRQDSPGLPSQDISEILFKSQKQYSPSTVSSLSTSESVIFASSSPDPTAFLKPEKEVFISYAWSGDSEEMANKVDTTLQSKDITLIRDKRDLGFKGRIKEFMEKIGRGNAVVVIISDKYLKSENCMFELVEIADNKDFCDRIFPIVLPDAQIYKPIKRIRYIQHWEQEIAELDEAMKTVDQANLQGFREAIDLYTRIRATIADLTETLKDMNALTSDIHTDSGFTELIKAIEDRLNK